MNEKFQLEILTRLAVIESKIDDYKYFKKKSEDAYNLSLSNEESIKEINDRSKWIWRTTVGALITGLISILTVYFKI